MTHAGWEFTKEYPLWKAITGRRTRRIGLGSNVPVTWNTWLIVGRNVFPLWTAPLPPFPTVPFSVPVPGFPPLAIIGVLTTFDTAGRIFCWDCDSVDTGPPSDRR